MNVIMSNIKNFEYLGTTISFYTSKLVNDNFLNLLYHEFEVEDVYNLKSISLNDGDVIIDCGANIGFFSIPLAKKYPNIKIYAFEADPRIYAVLLENIKLNNMENHKNLIVYNKAITNDGLPIFIDSFSHIGSNAVSSNKDGNIESMRLDALILQENIEKIKYLKMDIEGSEYDVLMNFANLNKVEYFGGEFHYGYFKNKKLLTYINKYINKDKCYVDGMQDKWAWYIHNFLDYIIKFCNKYIFLKPIASITLKFKMFARNVYCYIFTNKPKL